MISKLSLAAAGAALALGAWTGVAVAQGGGSSPQRSMNIEPASSTDPGTHNSASLAFGSGRAHEAGATSPAGSSERRSRDEPTTTEPALPPTTVTNDPAEGEAIEAPDVENDNEVNEPADNEATEPDGTSTTTAQAGENDQAETPDAPETEANDQPGGDDHEDTSTTTTGSTTSSTSTTVESSGDGNDQSGSGDNSGGDGSTSTTSSGGSGGSDGSDGGSS